MSLKIKHTDITQARTTNTMYRKTYKHISVFPHTHTQEFCLPCLVTLIQSFTWRTNYNLFLSDCQQLQQTLDTQFGFCVKPLHVAISHHGHHQRVAYHRFNNLNESCTRLQMNVNSSTVRLFLVFFFSSHVSS